MKTQTKRVTMQKVKGGYGVTGKTRTYKNYLAAFRAGWETCLKTGATFSAMRRNGQRVLLTAERIAGLNGAFKWYLKHHSVK